MLLDDNMEMTQMEYDGSPLRLSPLSQGQIYVRDGVGVGGYEFIIFRTVVCAIICQMKLYSTSIHPQPQNTAWLNSESE